ncbi:putative KHG/KDPG aldolase [Lachnospiraceae bacterium]|jgi:2-dehydro-3-deoxyphosphogluconate aldolase/(4S)-4-hydroxy-2-oxoglutarate aldolase|nr:bifunctional 4-hydroxy-2-oxoglutarate aldolase/2-dehydro-3-deoxy-phosphogluconate aldolase [Eubacterium sp.]GFI25288.1 putative KHG/KDPG aldolase [Lachnospiraceae bacterium]
MNKIYEEFFKIGIVPVVALKDASDAEPLAKALRDGGLPCAEVTFRTEAAQDAIRSMTEKFPDMLIGAGTVLTRGQVDAAVLAGAEFIVSPGFNPKVVSYCLEKEIPVIPGCSSPSDIEAAIELGLDVVKFFPAEASGGIEAIRAMSAPYRKIKFMPTGGIHAGNIKRYLHVPNVLACGGSWMVKSERIKHKDWDGITSLTKEAVFAMLGFTIRHVGIHCENEAEALDAGGRFAELIGAEKNVLNSSVVSGTYMEWVKCPGRGARGHIAVGTDSVERAVYQLTKRGFGFDLSSGVYDTCGCLKSIYFAEEIAGFAIHLIQNECREGV